VSDEILTERRGRVLVITIKRPESRNAVNLAVSQGLADAVDELDERADLSVAVITGARIPYQKALELALTGDSFTAEQGQAWGFVNVVTEPGEALAGALELAERITVNGPLAVATTKEMIVKSADWGEDEMWKKQLEHIIPIFTSNDAKEGAIAFAEKRSPNWTGT
jgi:enoyl-CoA hydratase/carnithine racemase